MYFTFNSLLLYTLELGLVLGSCSALLAYFKIGQLLKYGKTLHTTRARHCRQWWEIYLPKSMFTHFYVLDIMCSVVCLLYLTTTNSGQSYLSPLTLTFVLNTCQASRRLYECILITNWGSSKIHITHYIAGIYFYLTVNFIPLLNADALVNNSISKENVLSICAFFAFSIDQSFNHRHLYKLPKYTLPSRGLFEYAVCAHYFDEILIYISIWSIVGSFHYLCIILWVVVNLGVSANESWIWYQQSGFINHQGRVKHTFIAKKKLEAKAIDESKEFRTGKYISRKRLIPGIW